MSIKETLFIKSVWGYICERKNLAFNYASKRGNYLQNIFVDLLDFFNVFDVYIKHNVVYFLFIFYIFRSRRPLRCDIYKYVHMLSFRYTILKSVDYSLYLDGLNVGNWVNHKPTRIISLFIYFMNIQFVNYIN